MRKGLLLLGLLVALRAEAAPRAARTDAKTPRVSRAQAETLLARWQRIDQESWDRFALNPVLAAARLSENAPAALRARVLKLKARWQAARERVRSPAVLAALLRTRMHDDDIMRLTHDSPAAEPTADDARRSRISGVAQVRRAKVDDVQLHSEMPYMVVRGVEDYIYEHRERFAADLATWHSGMKILDGGAGMAVFFKELRERGLTAEMIAVGIAIPKGRGQLPSNVRYLKGKLGADRKLEAKLGPGTFDRIVDTLGAGSYTHDLHALLGTYGRLLKPGGKLFVAAEGYLANFVARDGTPMELPAFLSQLKGFRVEYADKVRFALVRTDEPLEIPLTRLVGRPFPLNRTFRVGARLAAN